MIRFVRFLDNEIWKKFKKRPKKVYPVGSYFPTGAVFLVEGIYGELAEGLDKCILGNIIKIERRVQNMIV